LAEAKAALPATVSTNRRAVTTKDYADILFAQDAPSGIAKANSARGPGNAVFIWVVPTGWGLMSNVMRNEIAEYLDTRQMTRDQPEAKDRVDVEMLLSLGVYVQPGFRPDTVIQKLRALFVTEDPNMTAGQGVFDLDRVGLGARDDEGQPQITLNRIHTLARGLAGFGLERVIVERLRTVPVSREPILRVNAGNGFVDSVTYLDPLKVQHREFRVLWKTASSFEVYRRIGGRVSLVTDTQVVDSALDLESFPDVTVPLPADSTLNPNRNQTLTFVIDTALTSGNTVTKLGGTGSLFGIARPGNEYYIEILDGTGTIISGNDFTTYVSPVGDVSFDVNIGTLAFTSGDELLIDIFSEQGDVILRPQELPVFTRNMSGVAEGFVTTVRN
jgi:hypothetical protein